MNRSTGLADHYTRWRQLTEAETQAIESETWSRLAQIQSEKRQLQATIAASDQRAAPRGGESPPAGTGNVAGLQRLLGELIRLETHNRDLLHRRMVAARAEKTALEQSARNLRGLHRSYARAPLSSAGYSRTA